MSSSQAIDSEDVILCLTDILDNFQIDVEVTTTDRHEMKQTRQEIKINTKFTHIRHQSDM